MGYGAACLNDHVEKQISFASFPYVETLIIEFIRQLKAIGLVINLDAQTRGQLLKSLPAHAVTSKPLTNNDFMDILLQRVLNSEDGRFMGIAERKELNKLKQRCIYVDLDENSEVASDPAAIAQETADYFLRLAHRVIKRYRSPGQAVREPEERREAARWSDGVLGGSADP